MGHPSQFESRSSCRVDWAQFPSSGEKFMAKPEKNMEIRESVPVQGNVGRAITKLRRVRQPLNQKFQ